jgi:hypothetical protein
MELYATDSHLKPYLPIIRKAINLVVVLTVPVREYKDFYICQNYITLNRFCNLSCVYRVDGIRVQLLNRDGTRFFEDAKIGLNLKTIFEDFLVFIRYTSMSSVTLRLVEIFGFMSTCFAGSFWYLSKSLGVWK